MALESHAFRYAVLARLVRALQGIDASRISRRDHPRVYLHKPTFSAETDIHFPIINILEDPGYPSVIGRRAVAALARDNESARYFDSVDVGPKGSSGGIVEFGLTLQGWVEEKEIGNLYYLMGLIRHKLIQIRNQKDRGLAATESGDSGILGFGRRAPMVDSLEFGRGFVSPFQQIDSSVVVPDRLSCYIHLIFELVEEYEDWTIEVEPHTEK